MPGRWQPVAVAGGFLAGLVIGGVLGWFFALHTWQMGAVGLLEGSLFILSFLLLMVGMVGPLVLVRYLADRADRLTGESGTPVGGFSLMISKPRQIGNAVGYVAIVVFYVLVAVIGGVLVGADVDPIEAIAVFDAVGGGVLGGIAGLSLASRSLRRMEDGR